MIQMDISVLCDDCKTVGKTLGGCRWLPYEPIQRPDLPRGWQWVYKEDTGWLNYCPNCSLVGVNK